MEMTLSLFAWLGVILIQAMVHLYLRLKRRSPCEDEEPPLEASPLVLEHLHVTGRECCHLACADAVESVSKEDNLSTAKTESIKSSDSMDEYDLSVHDALCLTETDDLSFDGDEPRIFFVLLSQTGSEMIQSCQSIEHAVREQIHDLPSSDIS